MPFELKRRGTLIAVFVLCLLAIVGYAASGYFAPEKTIQRLTGWTVPPAATLRSETADGSPFDGARNYVFDLPGSTLPDDAYCASLGLPWASAAAVTSAARPALKFAPPDLGGPAVCSRRETNQKLKHALSIEATRNVIVVQWTYF